MSDVRAGTRRAGRLGVVRATAALLAAVALVAPADPAAADSHTALYGWGYNDVGQLGTGSSGGSSKVPVPAVMPEGVEFQQVAGGDSASAALTDDGTVYMWGSGGSGLMGDGGTQSRSTPGPITAPGVTFEAVAVGTSFALALADNGIVYSWGNNSQAQLGNGNRGGEQHLPAPIDMPTGVTFTAVAAGNTFGLALATDGTVYSWGSNSFGQLGNGGGNQWQNSPAPITMPTGVTFSAISAGDDFALALADDAAGTMYGWGENGFGRLGVGDERLRESPTIAAMPQGVTFTEVAAGQSFGVALTDSGAAYTWGYNGNGQLGNGSDVESTDSPGPATMPDGVSFTDIDAGHRFAAGLTGDGAVYSWGDNSEGQLGIDSDETKGEPVRVHHPSIARFEVLALGTVHAVALAVPLPREITPTAGDGQTVHVHEPFPHRLVATVGYTDDTPIRDVEVTFTIQSPATFPDGATTAQATTGDDGTATSPPLTATGESGAVTVEAVADGIPGDATYHLTVLPAQTPSPTPTGSPTPGPTASPSPSPPSASATPAPSESSPAGSGGLPATGRPVALLLVLGTALVGLGAAAAVAGARRWRRTG